MYGDNFDYFLTPHTRKLSLQTIPNDCRPESNHANLCGYGQCCHSIHFCKYPILLKHRPQKFTTFYAMDL